ncbi:MAG: metalloregulator ArsR/SmtB family transcription factor [Spirochaetes bacterium]|nr:metalloregulator ArsR/SmtB family transcription factor [Spirochaetota bacterium]MBU1080023.1 metalloregulator ArsR/SmtB family transcription factor [Spirochaetota bacterium]
MNTDTEQDRCSCSIVHEGPVAAARAAEAPIARLLGLAELFKVLGDPSRLRILNALEAAELCVCDLSTALDMSQSAVSHQLATLRGARLVRARREGKAMFYALDDDHVSEIVGLASIHLEEKKE